jgi:hypothetical protein
MFTHRTHIGTNTLRKFDEIEELGEILLLSANAVLYIFGLEEVAKIEEEMIETSVRDRAGIKR